LPRDARDFTSQHEAFLDAAIEALADQGRVICVRLALFADLMKSRPWTPAALQTVGGPQGLAVTYLAENLDVDRTPRPRRPHAAAAEQVLRALLPPISSDIRETTLSRRQLQELTGLSGDQRAFTDLLGWLDSDLRLISPTTLAEQMTTKGGDPPAIGPPESGKGMRYQLTHDFLVPAIREWLRSKDLAIADRADGPVGSPSVGPIAPHFCGTRADPPPDPGSGPDGGRNPVSAASAAGAPAPGPLGRGGDSHPVVAGVAGMGAGSGTPA
jgi:hypothetical protein